MKLKKNNYCTYLYYLYFQGFNGKMGKAFSRHATSCVTTHDSYFQLPGLPSLLYITSVLLYVTSVISPVFYITDYFSNQIFPFIPSSFLPFLPSFFLFFGFPVCVSFVLPLYSPYFLFISLVYTPAPTCLTRV